MSTPTGTPTRGQRNAQYRQTRQASSRDLSSPTKAGSRRQKCQSRPELPLDAQCVKLQDLLTMLPEPCPRLRVVKSIGQGTFSTVYLAKQGEQKYALKHLVPTSSPDRILMEVDCLRRADGKSNVSPLLFVHRHMGDILLAMPYIDYTKFGHTINTMDHVEVRKYMSSLLKALVHIHQLGIIHRDIKPANFLYDRKKGEFALVDFGLAQKMGDEALAALETKSKEVKTPSCKRKLTSSDLADSNESPPPSATPVKSPTRQRKRRRVLSNRTADDQNAKQDPVNVKPEKRTPTKSTYQDLDTSAYYDRRGAMLSARKKTRASTRNKKHNMSDDLFELDSDVKEEGQEEEIITTPATTAATNTPVKAVADEMLQEVRRSPRKHPTPNPMSSSLMKTPGFSKLTISASAILSDHKGSQGSGFKRQGSFTILDPASGIPSDGTPRLQASLTSRGHSLLLPSNFHISLSSASATATTPGAAAGGAAPFQTHQSFVVGGGGGGNNPQAAGQNLPQEKKEPLINVTTKDRFATPNPRKTACNCFGKPRVCSRCLGKKSQRAARAGTPGFRPPEVLMKFEHQTTAVDMWATGVILLSMLSRTYPFFRAPDDITALGEFVAIFGNKAVEEAASHYGKKLICSENIEPLDLQVLCQRLAQRRPPEEIERSYNSVSTICLASDQAVDLLSKLLTLSSHERITAQSALEHPFFED